MSFVLRHTFKRKLAAAHDIERVRRLMDRTRQRIPAQIERERWGPPERRGERLRSRLTAARHTLLYVHGGGFVACSARTHRPITVTLADAGFDVLVPDYRLAPEHPFPKGLEDVWQAYADALAHAGGAARLVLCGDSAGAGLILSLLLRLRDAQLPRPAAAALFSPFSDLTLHTASVQTNARRCAMFTPETLARAVNLYLPPHVYTAEQASPALADLRDLPPLLIHVGADESLLDDASGLASRAQAAGIQVELRIWPDVPHAWQLFRDLIPEGRESLQQAATFLHHHAQGSP